MRSEDEPVGAWSGACWVAELREGEAGPRTVGRRLAMSISGSRGAGGMSALGGHGGGGSAPTAPPAFVRRPCFAAAPVACPP